MVLLLAEEGGFVGIFFAVAVPEAGEEGFWLWFGGGGHGGMGVTFRWSCDLIGV